MNVFQVNYQVAIGGTTVDKERMPLPVWLPVLYLQTYRRLAENPSKKVNYSDFFLHFKLTIELGLRVFLDTLQPPWLCLQPRVARRGVQNKQKIKSCSRCVRKMNSDIS